MQGENRAWPYERSSVLQNRMYGHLAVGCGSVAHYLIAQTETVQTDNVADIGKLVFAATASLALTSLPSACARSGCSIAFAALIASSTE